MENIQTSLEVNVFGSTMSASKTALETFKSTLEMGVHLPSSGPQVGLGITGREEKALLPFDLDEIPSISEF